MVAGDREELVLRGSKRKDLRAIRRDGGGGRPTSS
jgi:hypothetical protein